MTANEADPRYQLIAAVLEAEGVWTSFTDADGLRSMRARTPAEIAELVVDALDKFAGDEGFRSPESGEYYVSLRAAYEKALRKKLSYAVRMLQPHEDMRGFGGDKAAMRYGYRMGRDDAALVVLDGDL